ncbi:trichohyalin [Electrophorus electricus]|uniref:BED-type domain-containing protein n=1 Tax=Electrophorus electricus TaxID=8005 RepID=A0A4W4GF42_ELEEL|nr:trichohyalin [Electrophorus electricus]
MAARKRSIVWSFFQAEDNKRVLCLLCMKTVLYFGHTTNMLRHLRAKHPNDFSALDKRRETDKPAAHHNNSGCVEVTVVMDEQQVEVQSEVGDAEMDGAIRGILCAAAGEGEGSGCEREGTRGQEGSPVPSPTPSTQYPTPSARYPNPSTRKWSAVWVHYRKVDQEKKALCLLCMEKIQHQSSTSNLIRHLQNKHPAEYQQLEDHPQKRPPKRKPEELDYFPTSRAKSRVVTSDRSIQSHLNSSHTDKYSGIEWCERRRLLERERELTEALRRVQQEEGRSLQQQRDFIQQIRELEAERRALTTQKREQEDEHHRLKREKEELESTRLELQKEREDLQKEREELYKAKEEFQREREELSRAREELASGDGHLQGQVSRLYSC